MPATELMASRKRVNASDSLSSVAYTKNPIKKEKEAMKDGEKEFDKKKRILKRKKNEIDEE